MVSLPVHGANFWANKKEMQLNNRNECTIEIPEENCGLILVSTADGDSRIITFPGDDITINIVTQENGKPDIEYKGNNAAGHQFFNSLKRSRILDIENPFKNDTAASIITEKINAKRIKEYTVLSDLLKKGDVKAAYVGAVSWEIQYYYAASLADAMWSKYRQVKIARERKEKDSLFKEEYSNTWKRVFAHMPLDLSSAINTEYFKDYAGLYYEQYKGDFLQERKKYDTINSKKELSQKDRTHLVNYALINGYFHGEMAEYLVAQYLYLHLSQHDSGQSLRDIYGRFQQQYPHSEYSPYLKAAGDSVVPHDNNLKR